MKDVQVYDSLPELIANLGPLELKIYDELGQEDYLHLMSLWASIANDEFDEWYANTEEELAEHVIELSQIASKITAQFSKTKLLH
jgi:hypothetical protein